MGFLYAGHCQGSFGYSITSSGRVLYRRSFRLKRRGSCCVHGPARAKVVVKDCLEMRIKFICRSSALPLGLATVRPGAGAGEMATRR